MKILNRHLSKRQISNIALILGLAVFGLTLYTTVFANVIWTDKTLPWINTQVNARASGVLGVKCNPLDDTDTRAGNTIKASVKRTCPTVNVVNLVQFSSDNAGGIRTYMTAYTKTFSELSVERSAKPA